MYILRSRGLAVRLPRFINSETDMGFGLVIVALIALVWLLCAAPLRGSASSDEVTRLMERGREWLKEREYGNALDCFDAVLRLDPNNAYAFLCRGHCRHEKGDYAQEPWRTSPRRCTASRAGTKPCTAADEPGSRRRRYRSGHTRLRRSVANQPQVYRGPLGPIRRLGTEGGLAVGACGLR